MRESKIKGLDNLFYANFVFMIAVFFMLLLFLQYPFIFGVAGVVYVDVIIFVFQIWCALIIMVAIGYGLYRYFRIKNYKRQAEEDRNRVASERMESSNRSATILEEVIGVNTIIRDIKHYCQNPECGKELYITSVYRHCIGSHPWTNDEKVLKGYAEDVINQWVSGVVQWFCCDCNGDYKEYEYNRGHCINRMIFKMEEYMEDLKGYGFSEEIVEEYKYIVNIIIEEHKNGNYDSNLISFLNSKK